MTLLPLLAGCSSPPSAAAVPSESARALPAGTYHPEPARREGGSLRIGDWESPTNFAPYFNDEVPAREIDSLLYAGLILRDHQLRPVADLALRVPSLGNGDVTWDRTAQRMAVTYNLRPGLRWSDGQPLTAADVAFTWHTIANPQTQGVLASDDYRAIASIEVRDPLRFTVHFSRIVPGYLDLFPAILPEHRLATIPVDRLPQDAFFSRPDVVSGPYKIADLIADDHITLVRNDAWSQGRAGRRPHLDSILFRIYPEVGQLLAGARVGQVDMALEIPDDQLGALSNPGSMTVDRQAALAYWQVTFNQADPNPQTGQSPPWKNDPVVLQALRMAIDRAGLVKALAQGEAPLAASPISSLLSDFHDADATVRFDQAAATSALDADGWVAGGDGIRVKQGRRLAFSLVTALGNPMRTALRDDLLAEWRNIGAAVTASDAHTSDLFSGYAQGGKLERGQFEAGLWTWSTGADPDGAYALEHSSQIPTDQNQGTGSNFGRFQNTEIDRSLDRGRQTLNLGERVQAYAAFERAYARYGAELPLFERVQVVLHAPRLHNVLVNAGPATTTWNAADWWME
ncbi:MAG: peptide ABC transporter substrate-binding protein [Candidatus Dormibacter sp.]